MNLEQVVKARYSERDFSTRALGRELVEKVVASGSEAPNSCNMQTMQYIIVDEPKVREDMARIATKKFMWAPVNIIVLNDTRVTQKRHSAIMSIGMSVQNMMLTATDLGLATCPMAGFSNDAQIKKYFHLPAHLELVLVLALGYPAEHSMLPKRERIPTPDIIHWNEFAGDASLQNISVDVREWTMDQLVDYRRRIAPVYRYPDRFRLSTYDPMIYERLVGLVMRRIAKNDSSLSWFDYDSYDCEFVRALCKVTDRMFKVTISSNVSYILQQTGDLGSHVTTAALDLNGSPNENVGTFPVVSFVHKIQFIPDRYKALETCCGLVAEGGHLVLAFDTQNNLRWRIRRLFILVKAMLKGETFNVYENNPYYKIGPYHPVSKRKCIAILKRLGFVELESGFIRPDGARTFSSNETFYGVFQKRK
jgi:nitroreductase